MALYGGQVVREFFCSDDYICEDVSRERIIVEAFGEEAAELLIHEEYARNESRYTNRAGCLGDKVYVKGLKLIEKPVLTDKLIEAI